MGKVCSKAKCKGSSKLKKSEEVKVNKKSAPPEKTRETLLKEIISCDPNDGDAFNELGILEYEKGSQNSYALALKYLLRADKLSRADFVGCYYLGCIYLDHLDKPDNAIKFLLKSVNKNPGYDEPYNKLGEAYMKKNELPKALFYLQKGYELFQQRPDLLNTYGLALFNNDEIEKARKMLEKCLEVDSAHFKAYNNLGNVLRRQK